MHPTFKQLSIAQLNMLVTMLEVRNLSLAASEIGTSQSAMSRALAQFRDAFSDPLMVRQGREYVLTDRATALLDPLRDVLGQLHTISVAPQFQPDQCKRRFVFAGSDHVAQYILPSMVTALTTVAPDVNIDFIPWQAERYDWLASGAVDLITSMVQDAPADIHGRVIGEDLAVCCMSTGHSLANQRSVSLDRYLSWPHMKISSGGDKDSYLDAWLRKRGRERHMKLALPYYSAALATLPNSDMLLMLPEHIASKWALQNPVTWRPLTFLKHSFRYWMAWHSRTHTSAEQQWFRQFVFQHCHASQFLSPGATRRDTRLSCLQPQPRRIHHADALAIFRISHRSPAHHRHAWP